MMEKVHPLDIRIRPDDLRVPLNRIAAGSGAETIFVGPADPVTIPGFRLLFPGEIVAVRPHGQSGRGHRHRSASWKGVPIGLLRDADPEAPLAGRLPVGLLEPGQCLWLVDVRLHETVVGRLGFVGTPDEPDIRNRLQRLNLLAELDLWRRVGAVWEEHLDGDWAPPSHRDPDAVFSERLDRLAEELVRALGLDGVGIHVWREDLGGFLLAGYHGPRMERPKPGKLDTERSSWWFHRAGERSLVHAVFPMVSTGEPQSPLMWPSPGIEPCSAAMEELERKHPGLRVTSAVAAPLELRNHSLRGVIVAFQTSFRKSAPPSPLKALWKNWKRVHLAADRLPPSGRARLQAQALLAARKHFQRAVEERYHLLLRDAMASRTADDRKPRSPESEGEAMLMALRRLAGAWSGTLWEIDRPHRRRRALALLHPLPESRWGWEPLREGSVPRQVVDRRAPFLVVRRLGPDGTWSAQVGESPVALPPSSPTARWLHRNAPPGVDTSFSLTVPLHRAGETHAILTLSWWRPPAGWLSDVPVPQWEEMVSSLLRRLGPAMDAAAVHTATLVAWRRERERSRQVASLADLLDRKIQEAFENIGEQLLHGGGRPGRPLHELAAFVQRVCAEAGKLAGREVFFFRFEDWSQLGEGRTARQLAPAPAAGETGRLSSEAAARLEAAAHDARATGTIRPVAVQLPPSYGKAAAVGVPSVVGREAVGLLVIRGSVVDIEPEQAFWIMLAAGIGRELELLRRQIYRGIDERAEGDLEAARQALEPGGHLAAAVSRAAVDLVYRVTGARWSVLAVPAGHNHLDVLAGRGSHPSPDVFQPPLRRIGTQVWGRLFQNPTATHQAKGMGQALAVPLITGGVLHGWLAAGAPRYWSRDGTRLVKAVARRVAPALATAKSEDRQYLAMAQTHHGVRSAWQEVASGLGDIKGRLEDLRMTDRDLEEAISQADSGLHRARTRIDTSLYFSTRGLTARSVSKQATLLSDLVKEVVEAYRSAGRDRDLKIEIPSVASVVRVPGPPELVKLVVENLLENAVKYAARGTTVTVRLDVQTGVAVLRVIDTGRAFPVWKKEALLRPFSRAAGGEEGFGVGLAVVADCCRRLRAQWEPFSRPIRTQGKPLLHHVEMRVTFPLAE